MSADDGMARLMRTFDRCTERMMRVWEESPPPEEPMYRFQITFTASESVGNLIKQCVAASPTYDRTIKRKPLEGGDAGAQALH